MADNKSPALPPKTGKPAGSVTATRPPAAAQHSGHGGFMAALALLMLALFAFLFFLAFQAESLDDVAGVQSAPGTRVPNLKSLIAVGLSSGKDVAISEAEINGFIQATLHARQAGPLAAKGPLRGVVVRLKDGELEVILRRQLFGRPHTIAVHLAPSRETLPSGQARWNILPDGGKVGRLPVGGALLQLILKPVLQIGSAYSKELDILSYASSIRVEDDRILFGPVTLRQ